MGRSEKRMQNALQENGTDDVNVRPNYDEKLFKEIAQQSGAPSLVKDAVYIRTERFYYKSGFVSFAIGDQAFFAGVVGKEYFRLFIIAVRKQSQGKGYGKAMMHRIIQLCKKRGLHKITLRTNRNENAVSFYKRYGGRIIGIKGDDYEMEIQVCFTS